ncbi:hypothetical protein JCGZ_01035 [Jatropha curcas]|uniref:Transmembrane protein n=1 Tax=Jatropha curcas TaxID=180498 RepID=A0A067KWE6_JATCU|nr:uncharacterized protein LOC105633094 [Jatropha curcas]KDP39278.1 hypothetical protein JCGZ_01035 [Jatropha curcas]
MGKTGESRIFSSLHCIFKLSFLCFAVFVLSLIFFCFKTFGLSPFLVTISILFVSTIFIVTFLKKKGITIENIEKPNQDEGSICSPKSILVKEVEQKLNQELEIVTLCNSAQESEVSDIHDYQVESTDFPSASESGDDLSESENFELNWMSFNNASKNVAISEILGSSSEDDEDEDDNLIEISFPDSNSVELNEESEEKLQTYMSENVFNQEGLLELLADINEVTEEENLIEIDLSMGSIKG